jgi:hypothetical protein
MNNLTNQLSCLYYPFSRLLDSAILKYLLLIFDSITFLDEVEDTEWRKILLQDMARRTGNVFSTFQKLSDDYDLLAETGAIQIIAPRVLKTKKSMEVALATQADLSDSTFIKMCSNPSKFGLPSLLYDVFRGTPANKPTWQTFLGKIAEPLINDKQFTENKQWASHVLIPGNEASSWTLSYEGGSAAVTNFYLEAAQELNLTPITNSQLHHELVLRKLKRVFVESESNISLLDDFERKRYRTVLGKHEIIRLLEEIFPYSQLDKISFGEIVKFRNETKELRREFIRQIESTLRVIDNNPATIGYDKAVVQAINSMKFDLISIENKLASIRDKMLPSMSEAIMYGTAGGGALSALVSFLGGLSTGGLVAASALTISGTLLAKAMSCPTTTINRHQGQLKTAIR